MGRASNRNSCRFDEMTGCEEKVMLKEIQEDKDTSMIIHSCVNAEKMFWKCRASKLSLDLIIELWALEVTPEEREQMFWHLYLNYFVNTTMNRYEFHKALSHAKVGYYSKYRLWQHNKRCLLFFMRFYDGFVKDMQGFPKFAVNYDEAEKLLVWIRYQVQKLQEIRIFFPYCIECKFHSDDNCRYWEQIVSDTLEIQILPDKYQVLFLLRNFFSELEIECHCPRSLAELPQFKGRGNF